MNETNSLFDVEINRRGTSSIKWDIYPQEKIPLFIADMDFCSPKPIIDALQKRISHGIFGYTIPNDEIYDTIKEYFDREYHVHIDSSWIVWLPSIVPGLIASCNIFGRDSEVLVTVPEYSHLLTAPLHAGIKRVDSPLKSNTGKFEIDFDDLEKKLNSHVKLFMQSNPHNPVGRVYTRDELVKLSDFCKQHRLTVISDEIHCDLLYETKHIPFFTVDDYAFENSITFMSPNKTYNLAGIPCAFAIIPNSSLRKRFQTEITGLSDPGILELTACNAAYKYGGEWKHMLLDYLKGNRDYLEKKFTQKFKGAVFSHPEATYLFWVDFRPLGIKEPYNFFYKNANVVLTDGADFGAEGFTRINFGCSRNSLEVAIDQMYQAIMSNNR